MLFSFSLLSFFLPSIYRIPLLPLPLSYQRFGKTANGRRSDSGVQHLVIGMAGYELSTTIPNVTSPLIDVADYTHYGYTRLNFFNKTNGLVEFISDLDGRWPPKSV